MATIPRKRKWQIIMPMVLEYLRKNDKVTINAIREYLDKKGYRTHWITIYRLLGHLKVKNVVDFYKVSDKIILVELKK